MNPATSYHGVAFNEVPDSPNQIHGDIELGTELIVEAAIVDLFEKQNHQFCDVQVSAFRTRDDAAVMHTRLRAIYQLHGA